MAKARRRPGDRSLLPVLQGRAEALADTFNTQRVANTLWAYRYATLGRMRGEGLMRGREAVGEVVADTFKAHDVATTLWACATLGRAPGEGVMKGLEGRAEATGGPHVQGAERGQHAAGVCDAGVRVRGGADGGTAGETDGGGGGPI